VFRLVSPTMQSSPTFTDHHSVMRYKELAMSVCLHAAVVFTLL